MAINPNVELMARSDVVLVVSPDGPIIIAKDRYGNTTANGEVAKDGRVYVFIRNGDDEVQGDAADLREAYSALDALLTGIGLLPVNNVTTRPVLHKAVIRGLEVIDRAVKEGRYDATTD